VNPRIVQEWSNVDKSAWGAGVWQEEPDKVQMVDEATGFDCLIVRNGSGALCGYVGVPEGHPYFGVDYDQCAQKPPCEASWCDHSPSSAVSVHGGLTFADRCQEPTRELWERWRVQLRSRADEARQYPRGDAAEALREEGHLLDDYEAWYEHAVASFICHRPLDGRPDKVWWLGFDCSHSGDLSPKYAADPRLSSFGHGMYRTIGYVMSQCANLAQQLAKAAA
jgi:hypothetical protein